MGRTEFYCRTPVEWGVASRALPGQSTSGDLHLVKPRDNVCLMAVVDGVGHGDEATTAARTAVKVLEDHPTEQVISLVKLCHQTLLQTRGVVMTVASLQLAEGIISWVGVGNVEGVLFRADVNATPPSERVLLRSGLVGYQLPALQASVLSLAVGDLLVFATDGIRTGFTADLFNGDSAQQIADHILTHYLKGNDDALVLVVRYHGMRHD